MDRHAELTDEERQERSDKAQLLWAMRIRGRELNDSNVVKTLRDIARNGAKRYRGTYVDSFSASAFMAVYKKLNNQNKQKLVEIADKSLVKAISICFQLCNKR